MFTMIDLVIRDRKNHLSKGLFYINFVKQNLVKSTSMCFNL